MQLSSYNKLVHISNTNVEYFFLILIYKAVIFSRYSHKSHLEVDNNGLVIDIIYQSAALQKKIFV